MRLLPSYVAAYSSINLESGIDVYIFVHSIQFMFTHIQSIVAGIVLQKRKLFIKVIVIIMMPDKIFT